MRPPQFAALLGFAFAASWIGFDFGRAVLCLVGAAAFAVVALFLQGSIEIADLRRRFGSRDVAGR